MTGMVRLLLVVGGVVFAAAVVINVFRWLMSLVVPIALVAGIAGVLYVVVRQKALSSGNHHFLP